MTLCCIQLNLLSDQPAFPATALTAAMEAKRIITSDFEILHTVEQLAKLTGITEAGLQAAFKHLCGTTVAHFSRQAGRKKHTVFFLRQLIHCGWFA